MRQARGGDRTARTNRRAVVSHRHRPHPGESTAGVNVAVVAPKEQPPRNLSGTEDRLGLNSGKQLQPRLTEGENRHAGEALRFP